MSAGPPRRVLAIGHSHLGAITAAHDQLAPHDQPPYGFSAYQFLRSNRPHIVNVDGQWVYHPEITLDLIDLLAATRPDAVAFLLQGEQAFWAGLIAPEDPFDFILPSETNWTQNDPAPLIPFDLLFEAFQDQYRHVRKFLTGIRPHLPRAAFALCPPPPIGDDGFILAHTRDDEKLSRQFEEFGLPGAAWRQRLYRLHTLVMRAVYAEAGLAFIDPPAAAVGADGCLRPEFYGDLFHANVAYGRLVLDQIAEFLHQTPTQPEPVHV